MALKEWYDLDVSVRRSRRGLYNYIKEELEGGSAEDSSQDSTSQTPETRDISINVTDGTNPVQGASVVIGDVTKTTGSAGGCTFNGLTEGEHDISVVCDGFADFASTIIIAEENNNFEITLTSL